MPSSGRWLILFAWGFRRLRAASDFARGGKVTKTPPGDAADGHFVPIGPLTPGPPLRELPLTTRQGISGAQNLSGWPKFPPGHWALAVQKLPLLRFHNCAWPCRAGGGWCWVVGRGLLDAPCTSAGRPVSGPYEKKGRLWCLPAGAAISRLKAFSLLGRRCRAYARRMRGQDLPRFCRGAISRPQSLPPSRGKVPPKGADEGDLLASPPAAEVPRGFPTKPGRFS